MNNLLNVSNPDEKIKNILKQAINTRQSKIEQLTSQIDSIKKQEEDNIIFVPLSEPPEITPQEVASSIASIIGDVLTGFSEGVQQIREDTDTIHSSSQMGGQVDANATAGTGANQTSFSASWSAFDPTQSHFYEYPVRAFHQQVSDHHHVETGG